MTSQNPTISFDVNNSVDDHHPRHNSGSGSRRHASTPRIHPGIQPITNNTTHQPLPRGHQRVPSFAPILATATNNSSKHHHTHPLATLSAAATTNIATNSAAGAALKFMHSDASPRHNQTTAVVAAAAAAAAIQFQPSSAEDEARAAAMNSKFSERQLEADCVLFAYRIKEIASDYDDQPMLVRRGIIPALLGFLRAKANVDKDLVSTTIDALLLVSSHPKNREFLRKVPYFLKTLSEVHEDCLESDPLVRDQSARIIRNLGLSVTSTVAKHATNITQARKLDLMQVASRRSLSQIQNEDQKKAQLERQRKIAELNEKNRRENEERQAAEEQILQQKLMSQNDNNDDHNENNTSSNNSLSLTANNSSIVDLSLEDTTALNNTKKQLKFLLPEKPQNNNNCDDEIVAMNSTFTGSNENTIAFSESSGFQPDDSVLHSNLGDDVPQLFRKSSAYFAIKENHDDDDDVDGDAENSNKTDVNEKFSTAPKSILNGTLKEIDLETAFACLEQIEAEKALQARTGNVSNLKLKRLSSRKTEAERLQEAAFIIIRDSESKNFRSYTRLALAVLAIYNFFQVFFFYFLVHPPGMATGDRVNATDVLFPTDHWVLPPQVGLPYRNEVLVLEGFMQLVVTVSALSIFFSLSLTRRPKLLPELTFIPRNAVTTATDEEAFFSSQQKREMLLWCFHCPVGFAFINDDFRYLNGVCVLRLYCIIRASMEMTQFRSSMVRVMANFFGLRLTTAVFLRWALEFHKWKVLLPVFFFTYGFLTLCFSFAEGLSLYTSGWFIMVTLSTTGYGDIYPMTAAGRLVAIMAMIFGMVGLAYIVSQVQTLMTRETHEQKVLDALTLSSLRRRARDAAARVFWYRYKMHWMMQKWHKHIEEQNAYFARWNATSGDGMDEQNMNGNMSIAFNNNNNHSFVQGGQNPHPNAFSGAASPSSPFPHASHLGPPPRPLAPPVPLPHQPVHNVNNNNNNNNNNVNNNNNNTNSSTPFHRFPAAGVHKVAKALKGHARAASTMAFEGVNQLRNVIAAPVQHAVEYEYLKQAASKASAELTSILRQIQLLPPIHNTKEAQFFHVHETIDLMRGEQMEQTKLITTLTDTVLKLHQKLEHQEAKLKRMKDSSKKLKFVHSRNQNNNSSSINNNNNLNFHNQNRFNSSFGNIHSQMIAEGQSHDENSSRIASGAPVLRSHNSRSTVSPNHNHNHHVSRRSPFVHHQHHNQQQQQQQQGAIGTPQLPLAKSPHTSNQFQAQLPPPHNNNNNIWKNKHNNSNKHNQDRNSPSVPNNLSHQGTASFKSVPSMGSGNFGTRNNNSAARSPVGSNGQQNRESFDEILRRKQQNYGDEMHSSGQDDDDEEGEEEQSDDVTDDSTEQNE